MWITRHTKYTVCIRSNGAQNNIRARRAGMPSLLSRGTASLLDLKDQEATAGGLWCPHFYTHNAACDRMRSLASVQRGTARKNSHDQMCVVTSCLGRAVHVLIEELSLPRGGFSSSSCVRIPLRTE